MKTVELKINDADLAGVNAVALVEIPATEIEFQAFSKQNITDEWLFEQLLRVEFSDEINKSHKVSTDEESTLTHNEFARELAEKQMIITPIMRANFMIPRITEEGEEYQVFFSEDTVRNIAYKTLTEKKQYNINLEHNKDEVVDGVVLVETWIVEDHKKDKSVLYGFSPEKGWWMGMYKIYNKDIWDNYIKTGKVRGTSAEGYFIETLVSK